MVKCSLASAIYDDLLSTYIKRSATVTYTEIHWKHTSEIVTFHSGLSVKDLNHCAVG